MKYTDHIGIVDIVIGRFRARAESDGLLSATGYMLRLGFSVLSTPYHAFMLRKKRFAFLGEQLPYFCHWYNTTFDNERAVEISLARHFLQQAEGKRVLEVGNVLSHYGSTRHDILDKYEKGQGIIQEDVADYRPGKTYDLIISI